MFICASCRKKELLGLLYIEYCPTCVATAEALKLVPPYTPPEKPPPQRERWRFPSVREEYLDQWHKPFIREIHPPRWVEGEQFNGYDETDYGCFEDFTLSHEMRANAQIHLNMEEDLIEDYYFEMIEPIPWIGGSFWHR